MSNNLAVMLKVYTFLLKKRGACLPPGSEQLIMDNNQRIIQGTVRASAGEYLMNKKEVFAHGKNGENLDNGTAVVQKHDSYARYLAKKKGGAVLREQNGRDNVALKGGKTKRFGMFAYCSGNCS